jgi:hypothetical protein
MTSADVRESPEGVIGEIAAYSEVAKTKPLVPWSPL